LPNGGGVGAQAAGRYRFARLVSAVFERDDEQEPTDDGRPPRKGERLSYSILWGGEHVHVRENRPAFHGGRQNARRFGSKIRGQPDQG
jgi:hypothetical protein